MLSYSPAAQPTQRFTAMLHKPGKTDKGLACKTFKETSRIQQKMVLGIQQMAPLLLNHF